MKRATRQSGPAAGGRSVNHFLSAATSRRQDDLVRYCLNNQFGIFFCLHTPTHDDAAGSNHHLLTRPAVRGTK